MVIADTMNSTSMALSASWFVQALLL